MTKKHLLALVLTLALCLVALPALAATSDAVVKPGQGNLQWLEQRLDAQKNNIDQLVKDGTITAEQGQAIKNQLNQNYKLRQQGQYAPLGGGQGIKNRGMGMMGGFGQCGGQGMGKGVLGQYGACPYYPAK